MSYICYIIFGDIMKEYSYPIDYTMFTVEEVIKITNLYKLVEDANEGKINKERLLTAYKEYRNVINSISIEKQMDKEFEKVSGYSVFETMKKVNG